jgi:hypothetical protein
MPVPVLGGTGTGKPMPFLVPAPAGTGTALNKFKKIISIMIKKIIKIIIIIRI